MKRTQGPRISYPTPTTFSGISSYRTDSYRPLRDTEADIPAVPPIDYRLNSKILFAELGIYLEFYLAKAPPNSRSTARQKLTRLTIQQFHELSTDVYDELIRRKNQNEVPFLPVREDFHPKRNQARQKLATLPASRFEDLSSDVYYELARRYPEFKEEESRPIPSPVSTYDDDFPSPDFPTTPILPRNLNGLTQYPDLRGPSPDSGYGSSISAQAQRRAPPTHPRFVPRRSEDAYPAPSKPAVTEPFPGGIVSRKISKVRKSDERDCELPRHPGQSVSTASDATAGAPSSTAISGMIVLNKSTITEEDIEVPYTREVRATGGGLGSASDYMGSRSPFGALSGFSARLRDVEDEDDVGGA